LSRVPAESDKLAGSGRSRSRSRSSRRADTRDEALIAVNTARLPALLGVKCRATIVADVRRFCHQIDTDEVFGTHTHTHPQRQARRLVGVAAAMLG
jgi:hypothetical protein